MKDYGPVCGVQDLLSSLPMLNAATKRKNGRTHIRFESKKQCTNTEQAAENALLAAVLGNLHIYTSTIECRMRTAIP